MSMIDRYKKKGGFIQLLNLLETTGGEKREKFLKMIADENPAWEAEIKKKMLTVDRMCTWYGTFLMEIFPRIPAQQMAAVISALSSDKQAIFQSALSYKDKKFVEDYLKEKTPNQGEVNSAIMRLMSTVREMVAIGALKFEKFDQEMVIPENIEELLASGKSAISDKELEAHFAPPPPGLSPQVTDELNQLRRKLVQLTQENQKLTQEAQTYKDKLEQIRKIA
jgi:hypothetical protein